MKRFSFCILLFFLLTGSALKAQEKGNVFKFDFNKLKPIAQIFGTAKFDAQTNHYGYSFRRAHLGIQYQFNEKWNAKIIIDRGRPTSVGEITVADANGNLLTVQNTSKEGAYYTMLLKFASLQWNVNNKLSLEGGAILQNHYITQERFWGLRFVAQTFQDLYWKIPSSDLGFTAHYKFNAVFSGDVALTNGEGPRVVQDAGGKVKIAAGLDINPTRKIQSRVYYHHRAGSINDSAKEQMFSAFAGVKPTQKWRLGVEYNSMQNLNHFSELKSFGFSGYSVFQPSPKVQFFARIDRLKYDNPDNIASTGNGTGTFDGFVFSPVQNINLSLNYQGFAFDSTNNANRNGFLLSMEFKI